MNGLDDAEKFKLRAAMLLVSADLKARVKLIKHKGATAIRGCPSCDMTGVRRRNKTMYVNNRMCTKIKSRYRNDKRLGPVPEKRTFKQRTTKLYLKVCHGRQLLDQILLFPRNDLYHASSLMTHVHLHLYLHFRNNHRTRRLLKLSRLRTTRCTRNTARRQV